MNYSQLSKNLETICAISMTPFKKEDKKIDWGGVEENANFLVENGIKVITLCGNTSEFYALTIDEAKKEISKVVEVVNGRAMVVAGIGYSVETAIEMGKHAKEAGADAVMIHMPVHPFINESGATSYFKEIIEAIKLPSIIYFKNPNISDSVLKELIKLDKLIGVKYAINDLPRFAKLLKEVPQDCNVTWVCGTAEKWAPFFFNAGAKGYTSGLVNLYPQKSFELLKAMEQGDSEIVWDIWNKLLPFENMRAKYNDGINVAALKEAMNLIGFNGGVTRPPVDSLDQEDKDEVARILTDWGLLENIHS